VRIDGERGTVTLAKADCRIGLGGIAKGYAVDKAFEKLSFFDFRGVLVNLGGDLRVGGRNENGEIWRVRVQHPRRTGEALAFLPLTNVAVATSGDYQRFFVEKGKKYHHILDPSTGFPARRCQSVTVVAPDATRADALATAFFILGPKKALKIAASTLGVETFIVDAEGKIHMSPGLKG
jgi:thiamine biosynthesis lipoprotein